MSKCLCPICKSDQTALITNELRFGNKASVMRCSECSLFFLDRNSFQLPRDFYEKQYHQTYLTHVEPDALDPEKYFEKMMTASKPWSDKIKKILKGNETVLDVGCSTGHLIVSLKDHVKDIYGYELSRKEVDFCKNKLGLDVSDEPLDKRFEKKKFDFITMIFVLEHIGEPLGFLNDLKKYLKPGGKFLILVPNIKDALVNFYEIPEFYQFYFCIEHLYYYSEKTISDLFSRAGLKGAIETIQEYPITNHLNWGYRKKPLDVLASRRTIPDIKLRSESSMDEWVKLWKSFDIEYKNFLTKNGYGDRLWCSAGVQNDKSK